MLTVPNVLVNIFTVSAGLFYSEGVISILF